MDEIIEKSRGSTLECTVTEKLRKPADDMKNSGGLEGDIGILLVQVIAVGRATHAESSQQKTSHRLQQHVKQGVQESSNGTKVEFKIGDGQP